MTQHERIIEYIEKFGSITPMDAFSDLGITKLATRVSEMRRRGIPIKCNFEKSFNRYGQAVSYMRYTLEKGVTGND